MKDRVLYILISFLILLVFCPVLSGYFFMDDFYFLSISRAASLIDFLKFFSPIKNIPYRFISQQLFFFSMQKIFGLNPLPYHLLILFIHLINSLLIYKVFLLLGNKNKSYLLSIIYAVSAIHFVGLFSITGSYFIFGMFYFLISVYFWLNFIIQSKKKYYFLSFLFYIMAVFSSEITMVFPLIILLISSKSKLFSNFIKIIPFFIVSLINIFINYKFAGAPKTDAFMMDIKAFPATFKWYMLRALGLPEGIKNGTNIEKNLIYLLFALLLLIICYSVWKNLTKIKQNVYQILKYLLWLLLASVLFFIMPNHLNPIYFSISLIGLLMIFAILLKYKFLFLFTSIYLLISLFSIKLLMHTHWTVRRSNLARFWITQTIDSIKQPQNNVIELILLDDKAKEELQITLQGDKAFKLFFNNPLLKTVYKVH